MLVLALIVSTLIYTNFFHPTLTVEEVNRWIAAELPQGSTVQETNAFLLRHNVTGSIYHDRDRLLTAAVRDTYKGIFIKCGIYMEFYYDHGRKLRNHTVQEDMTTGSRNTDLRLSMHDLSATVPSSARI